MLRHSFLRLNSLGLLLGLLLSTGAAMAESRHGIAMYGEPALPPDFVALPQTNPDAPKGGSITLGEAGGFDTLNPFISTGRPAVGITPLVVETLMGRNYDEAFSLYGLLAESIDTDSARSYVEFTLREQARFSDGSPVTPEDVLWSFEKLGTEGNPRYHAVWGKIASATITGPRSIRFTFNTPDRELPLLLGMRPVLKKAQWEGRDFEASGYEAPVGSGPYLVDRIERGTSIIYRRNPDWWGKDLPFNRGQWNFDRIRYDYYSNANSFFEAFTAGSLSVFREGNLQKWLAYDFPALRRGDVVKSEIPHHRPSGIEGFAFNTRRPLFQDWRVREALILAFNFEQINALLNDSIPPRIESYFTNSPLAMTSGAPASAAEAALLAPYAAELPYGTLEGYALPVSDGRPANRPNIRKAARLLEEAGWVVDDRGVLRNAAGDAFHFEILLTTGQDDLARVAAIYVEALKPLGIEASYTMVDSALMKERTNDYDFDMTHYIRTLSLSPGNELYNYWGSASAKAPGSRNWPGVDSPAVDAMIGALLTAPDPESFTTAAKALDRVLTAGRYVIPIWYADRARVAHRKQLQFPAHLPLYGDSLGFLPDVWWYEEQ